MFTRKPTTLAIPKKVTLYFLGADYYGHREYVALQN